ncbi:UDP-glucuronosyltransferase like transferase [Gordonia terrae C-6]|uniref:UDP-glucuronosyltransferase like transferase n=1 Tax=Gordonia terrae C-6 TaxID=1316928 RepID=R7Y8T6_9ACTN|nr:glycosyltransferase [Gordonia terrae]EON32420.1 UDP-glucuronosyltransferase like transferase [Gordonia terrae C-6]
MIAVNGSRGDAQPAVALAAELLGRGHGVTLATPPDLAGFGSGAGVPTEVYGESTRSLLDSGLVREDMRSKNPRTRLRAVSAMSVRGGRTMQQRLLELADGADAIVASSAGQERAHNVSAVLGIPHIPLHYCPIRRNSSVSLLAHVGVDAPAVVNDLSWRVAERALWLATRSAENTLRTDLGLSPLNRPYSELIARTGVPEIQAYDPALFEGLAAQWGPRRPLVGFFTLAAAQRAGVGDAGLDGASGAGTLGEWLDAGDAPVYVGFGSMLPADPDGLADAFRTAAQRLGIRLLVSGGWSGFMSSESTSGAMISGDAVHVVGHVDHDTVLPRCRAAVHHGGAGSVAAGLRAGLPTLVTWVGADQPIWGRAVSKARVGATLPMARVTAKSLIPALEQILDADTRQRSADLRRRLVPPGEAVRSAADIAERAAGAGATGRRAD